MPSPPSGYTHVHGYCPSCMVVTLWEIVGNSARFRTTYTCFNCFRQEFYCWGRSYNTREGESETIPVFQSAFDRDPYRLPKN